MSGCQLSDGILNCIEHGKGPAIIVEQGSLSWSYMASAISELKSAVAPDGHGGGFSVGIVTRNRAPHLALFAAAFALRHCYVALSPMFADQDLALDIESLGLHVVAASRDDLSRSGVMDAAITSGAAVIELSDDPKRPLRVLREMKPGRNLPDRSGVAVAMLTSGTTGPPKRISLTYDNLDAALGQAGPVKRSGRTKESTVLRPALVWHPIGHISGAAFVVDALSSGRPIILMERFDPERWAFYIERYEVRLAQVNPTAMRMILDADIDPSRLSSLRYVRGGTTGTPPQLQEAFESRFQVPFMTTYGATEFAGAVASWSPEDYLRYGKSHRGSSGRAHPGVHLRTVDPESGRVLANGEQGVLEVLAPQSAQGNGNWVRTTDLALIDEEGFLWIMGRVDDAIVRGGFKVHPGKVEWVLKEHPAVLDAAVVGIEDDRLGAVPAAAVVLRENIDPPSESDLKVFVERRLARYEVPIRIVFVDTLPLTLSMKVSRPALRALFSS